MQQRLRFVVNNWYKLNPREQEGKHYAWFRLYSDFFQDQAVFEATPSQKLLYLFLLCEASKVSKAKVEFLPSFIAASTGLPVEQIVADSDALQMLGLIKAELFIPLLEKPLIPEQMEIVIEENPEKTSSCENEAFTLKTRGEEIRNTHVAGKKPPAMRPLPRLGELWNEHCGSLAKAKGSNFSRDRKAKKLMQINPSEEFWISVIKRIAASSFCCGGGGTGWRAGLDWFLGENNYLKVIEGAYDDRVKLTPGERPVGRTFEEEEAMRAKKQAEDDEWVKKWKQRRDETGVTTASDVEAS